MDETTQQIQADLTAEWLAREQRAKTKAKAKAPTSNGSGNHKPSGPWHIRREGRPMPGSAPRFDDLPDHLLPLWFGALASDPDTCRPVWGYLNAWVARTFPGCHLLYTPGYTGLALILHTLPFGKGHDVPHEYNQLAPDLGRKLAGMTGQHRQEYVGLPGIVLHHLRAYDARARYLNSLRRLPVLLADSFPEPIVDDVPDFADYRQAKYAGIVTVPDGSQGIGLVGRKRGPGAWEWPSTPGEQWQTGWIDACEVQLLLDCGWGFRITRRMLFAPQGTPGEDPLKTFAERMIGAIEEVDRQYQKAPTPGRRALRTALRAIAIHPIGLWHRRFQHRHEHVDDLDQIDELDWLDDSVGTAPLITPTGHPYAPLGPSEGYEGLGYDVTGDLPLTIWQRHWRRPEWSTTVYARTRVFVTRQALKVPRSSLIAIDGDGLYTNNHVLDLDPARAGRVGELRLKHEHTWPDGFPAPDPADRAALDTLRGLMKGTNAS